MTTQPNTTPVTLTPAELAEAEALAGEATSYVLRLADSLSYLCDFGPEYPCAQWHWDKRRRYRFATASEARVFGSWHQSSSGVADQDIRVVRVRPIRLSLRLAKAERDAALARAEKAEAERDEWRQKVEKIAALYSGCVDDAAPSWAADATITAIGDVLGSVPSEVHERGWQWRPVDTDTAFAPPFGTIRVCRACGCLVAGGPTACGRCAAAVERK